MDWWTRVLTGIDCFTIVVRIPLEGKRILVVQRGRFVKDLKLVSIIKMRKYLEKDYAMVLARIMGKGANVKKIPIERNHTEINIQGVCGALDGAVNILGPSGELDGNLTLSGYWVFSWVEIPTYEDYVVLWIEP
nr:hypothetical protein [Tanacetum cinerariifolium]